MEKLLKQIITDSPLHGVIKNLQNYDVKEINFSWGYDSHSDGYLKIELSNHEHYVELEFLGVQGLIVPENSLLSAIDVRIYDVSSFLHMNAVIAPIRVQAKEGRCGIEFWADKVNLIKFL